MRAALALAALLAAGAAAARPVEVSGFGQLADGRAAHLYTLTNAHGMRVRISDWGALIVAVDVPDRAGHMADVADGFGDVGTYQRRNPDYRFGAPIGRFANRIGHARFTLDGKTVQLVPNYPPNILHSGSSPGFDQRFWHAAPFDRGSASGVVMTMTSPDGDQGFPGALSVTITYTLDNTNALHIAYRATTTKPTVINLTNHSYWNLSGAGNGTVLGERLQVMADRLAELDAEKVPTGKLIPVSGGLDLRKPRIIGQAIASDPAISDGYDHPYVLADEERATPVLAARVFDPASGRTLDLSTTEPSIQVYTANSMKGVDHAPEGGGAYILHGGLALETQHLPDSPNHPGFPTTVLRPGQVFRSETVLRFGVAP